MKQENKMSENAAETTTIQAPEYVDYVPHLINFLCYRTKRSGWQPAGWVICEMQATDISLCPEIDGATWVRAPQGKYKSGDIFDPKNP